jgi:hypothetical protein
MAITVPDHTDADESPAVAAVRNRLMDGLADVNTFATALGKSRRRVQQLLAEGLPHIHYGQTPYVQIDKAKDWLLSRSKAD